jgi:hypothetical protein
MFDVEVEKSTMSTYTTAIATWELLHGRIMRCNILWSDPSPEVAVEFIKTSGLKWCKTQKLPYTV